jgi:hypothetical protein
MRYWHIEGEHIKAKIFLANDKGDHSVMIPPEVT